MRAGREYMGHRSAEQGFLQHNGKLDYATPPYSLCIRTLLRVCADCSASLSAPINMDLDCLGKVGHQPRRPGCYGSLYNTYNTYDVWLLPPAPAG